jgi:hypothetical protein
MAALKSTVFTTLAATGLLCLPVTPASAAGPLLFAPWVLGHVIGAGVRLATLPLLAASAASYAGQPQTPYPPSPGYYGAPGYYASYYQRPPVYYGPPQGYYPAPQAYYRPAPAYAPPLPRYYVPTRAYYAPRASYSGFYGAQAYYRSGSFAYRRR